MSIWTSIAAWFGVDEEARAARREARRLKCLECGLWVTRLDRHLKSAHDLTPEAYRAKHGLPADAPMIAPYYLRKRAAIASGGRRD